MKKIMLIAMAMLLATPVIAATYSNPVGFIKDTMTGSGAWSMISVPMGLDDYALNDTDPAVTCAGEMISENLVGNSNSTLAPQIWKYAGGSWESAFLFGGIPGHPLDGLWVAAGPSTMVLDPTIGVYLKNPGTTADAVILGDVPVADTVDVILDTGWSMRTFPYPVTVGVNDGNFVNIADGATANSNSTLADQVWKYTGTWESAFLFGGIPGHPLDDMWVAAGPSTMTLDPGQAFYYLARTGFTWTVERPFTLN